jgi:hypothetical protein
MIIKNNYIIKHNYFIYAFRTYFYLVKIWANTMVLDKAEEVYVTGKRPRLDVDTKTTQTNLLAGPAQQASHRP